MRPFLRARNRGGSGTIAPPSFLFKGRSTNLNVVSYFCGEPFTFTNLVNMGYYFRNADTTDSIYLDANGWLANVPPGAYVDMELWPNRAIDISSAYFAPGNYTVTSPTNAYFTISGTGVTVTQQGTSSATQSVRAANFTVPDVGDNVENLADIFVKINIPSGPNISILNQRQLYIGLASNYTTYQAKANAAADFDSRALAQLAGTSMIRYNDWSGINSAIVHTYDYASLPTEATRAWNDSNRPNLNVPYEICARLSKALNCGVWFPVAVGNHQLCYSADDASNTLTVYGHNAFNYYTPELRAHTLVENEPFCFWDSATVVAPLVRETVYYAKNVTTYTLQVSLTPGGAAVNLTQSLALDFTHGINPVRDPTAYYNAVVDRILTEYPDCPMLVGEVGNESWNSLYERSYLTSCGTTCAKHFDGRVFTDGSQAYAYYQWKLWKAIELRVGRSRNKRLTTMQIGTVSGGDGFGNFGGNLTTQDTTGIISLNTPHSQIIDGMMIAPYHGPAASYATLQAIRDVASWTNAQLRDKFKTAIDTDTTAVLAQFVAAKAAAGYASTPLYTYECGPGFSSDQGGLTAGKYAEWCSKIRAFLQSAEGGDLAAYYLQQVFVNYGLVNANIWQSGNWVHTNTNSAWGMNRAITMNDSPYALVFKGWAG